MFGIFGSVFIGWVDLETTGRRFSKKRVFLAGGLMEEALETVDFAREVVNRSEGKVDTVDLLSLTMVVE